MRRCARDTNVSTATGDDLFPSDFSSAEHTTVDETPVIVDVNWGAYKKATVRMTRLHCRVIEDMGA